MIYELQVWQIGFGWKKEAVTTKYQEIFDTAEIYIKQGYRIQIESREKER